MENKKTFNFQNTVNCIDEELSGILLMLLILFYLYRPFKQWTYSVENIWFISSWKHVDRNCHLNFNDVIST